MPLDDYTSKTWRIVEEGVISECKKGDRVIIDHPPSNSGNVVTIQCGDKTFTGAYQSVTNTIEIDGGFEIRLQIMFGPSAGGSSALGGSWTAADHPTGSDG